MNTKHTFTQASAKFTAPGVKARSAVNAALGGAAHGASHVAATAATLGTKVLGSAFGLIKGFVRGNAELKTYDQRTTMLGTLD